MEAEVKGRADTWRERIAGQRSSGQSIRAWCRQNNHHEHAFYWWRSRLGLSPRSAGKRSRRRESRRIKFAQLVVDRSVVEPMCLHLGGGRELILPASMSMQQVAALIRALEAAQ